MVPFVNVHVSAVKRKVLWSGVLLDPSDRFGAFATCGTSILYFVRMYNLLLLCSFIKYSNFSVFCVLNVTTSLPHVN